MTVRFADQTTTRISGVDVPLPGVTIYVYSTDTGQLATLTADGGGALANPFTSDALGNYAINVANPGLYDLAFYVGGKQVFRENGVYVGPGDRLTTLVQNIIGATPLTVNVVTGTAFSYPTRGGISGITSTTIGQRVLLAEAGRLGWFELKAGDYAARVTADATYQGLYLPHATLATSAAAWVRDVAGSVYLAAWWGVGAAFGVNNHLPLQSALDLVPPGSTVQLPAEAFTVSGKTFLRQVGLRLFGAGVGITEVIHNAATGAFDVIQLARSGCEVAYLTVTGKPTNVFSGNATCIIVTNTNSGFVGNASITDLQVHDVHLRNVSLCMVFFGLSVDGVGVFPVKNVRAWNLDLEPNVQGFSIFGADDVEVHSFRITYFESVATHNSGNGEVPGIRILGSQNVHVHDGLMTGGMPTTNAGHVAIRMDVADLGGTSGRRQNQNITVERVRASNFFSGPEVDEALGRNFIRDCHFEGDVTSTAATAAFSVVPQGAPGGVTTAVGTIHIIDCTARGYAMGVGYFGPIRQLRVQGCQWIGNALTPDGLTSIAIRSDFGGAKLAEFIDCSFIHPSTGFRCNSSAGEVIRVLGCTYSEGATNIQTPYTAGAGFFGTGAGTYISDQNRSWPVGTWAAMVA